MTELHEELRKAEVCVNCNIARYSHLHRWYIPSQVVAAFLEGNRKELKEHLCLLNFKDADGDTMYCQTYSPEDGERVYCLVCIAVDKFLGGGEK